METNINLYNSNQKYNVLLVVMSVLIGIVFVSMALWGGFCFGLTLTNLLLIVVGTIYFKVKKIKTGFFGIALLILCCLGSLVFSITVNTLVNVTLFGILFVGISAYFYLINRGSDAIGDLRILPVVFASTFATTLENLTKSTNVLLSSNVKNSSNYTKMLVGFLCAVPVLMVIIPLLISSDAAFESIFNNISKDILLWLLKVFLGILISPVIFSYFFSNRNYKDNFNFKNGLQRDKIDGFYAVSFLSMISVCYLVYVFSQLAYIFSGLSGILPENFTVAQYARRGFFEITAIAIINFIIMGSSLLLIKRSKGLIDKIIRIFIWFIGLFTILLIVTAIAKMILYIKSFGMTELRILTSVFLVFLLVLRIVFIMRCVSPKICLFRPALILALLFATVVGFIGTDRFVSAYNTKAYISGKIDTVDVYTMSESGYASAKYLIKLEEHLVRTEAESSETYEKTVNGLIDVFNGMYEIDKKGLYNRKNEFSIASFNLEKELAYGHFDKYLKENPTFLQEVENRKAEENDYIINDESEFIDEHTEIVEDEYAY